MKKFKILFSAAALMLGMSAFAQTDAKENPSNSEKIEGTKTEEKSTMKDAAATAKEYTAGMIKALRITDKSLIQTITSLNENYEVTLLKTTEKSNMSEEEVEKLKEKLEANRVRRLEGILTPTQLKEYQVWKTKTAAATEK